MSTVQLSPSGRAYVRREGHRILRRYDRVSHVLDTGFPMWEGIHEDILEERSQLGLEVHKLCEELIRAKDQEALLRTYPSHLTGYGEAWLKFQADSHFRPFIVEEPLSSEQFGVAGRPDTIGETSKTPTVIDYTIGSPGKRKRLQTAIYERLWKDTHGDRRRFQRIEVHLKETGRYNFRPHRDPNDIYAFVGLLQFYRWLRAAA